MGAKQAIGWMLIAVAGIVSVTIFTTSMVERSIVPVSSPEAPPVVGIVPLDGE